MKLTRALSVHMSLPGGFDCQDSGQLWAMTLKASFSTGYSRERLPDSTTRMSQHILGAAFTMVLQWWALTASQSFPGAGHRPHGPGTKPDLQVNFLTWAQIWLITVNLSDGLDPQVNLASHPALFPCWCSRVGPGWWGACPATPLIFMGSSQPLQHSKRIIWSGYFSFLLH